MSDLIAVLAIGDRVLHLIDFDRPVWCRPGSRAPGVTPAPECFVADALLALAADQVLIDPVPDLRGSLPSPDDAGRVLNAARAAVYAATRPGLLYLSDGPPGSLASGDLARLSMPVHVLPLPPKAAEELRS